MISFGMNYNHEKETLIRQVSFFKQVPNHEYVCSIAMAKLEFLRLGTDEDIAYRKRQYKNFIKNINKTVPDDLPLCFHGCPIYSARSILVNGKIFPTVNKINIDSGQFGITTKKDAFLSLRRYIDILNFNMPAGCIFVILARPQDKKVRLLLMDSIDLKTEPDRLVAIITTPENITRVKKWASIGGIASTKVFDFDTFITTLQYSIAN